MVHNSTLFTTLKSCVCVSLLNLNLNLTLTLNLNLCVSLLEALVMNDSDADNSLY